MRDRRAAQAEALAVLRAGLRDIAANHPEALARLPGDLDAFVEATAAAVLARLPVDGDEFDEFVEATAAAAIAECDRNAAADGVLAEFDALTKGHN